MPRRPAHLPPRDLTYETATGRQAEPEAIALRRWIHQRYVADPDDRLPGRFRYYEAIMAGIIAKHLAQEVVKTRKQAAETDDDDDEPVRPVTKGDILWKAASNWVRKRGLVPEEWITDTTRHLVDHLGFASVVAGIDAWLGDIHLDPWQGCPPLLVVESEASGAVLAPVCEDYRIAMAPLRGQASRSFLANDVTPMTHDGQVVLVVVDLDKVGEDISESAKVRLQAFSGHSFDWRVIALTEAQIDRYAIVKIPRIDRRDSIPRMVAETEALGAELLRSIVRAELDALLPEPLADVGQRERAEREDLIRRLNRP